MIIRFVVCKRDKISRQSCSFFEDYFWFTFQKIFLPRYQKWRISDRYFSRSTSSESEVSSERKV